MQIPHFQPPTFEDTVAGHRVRAIEPLAAAHAKQASQGGRAIASVSLASWIVEAEAAGIPHVPATLAWELPIETLFRFEAPEPQDALHWARLEQTNAQVGPEEMLRWDCCAGIALKMTMAEGVAGGDAATPRPNTTAAPEWRAGLHPDDPRFFDIAFEYPGASIAVLKRPWIPARMEGSHPAEYRVFVRNGEVRGVANYYLQRDLAHSAQVHAEVEQVIAWTTQLLASMHARRTVAFNLRANELPEEFDPAKTSCTLDYLIDASGEARLLEGGPPFGLGAHPCAFMHNLQVCNGSEQISVDGVCLGLDQAPLPLEDFLPDARQRQQERSAGRERA